MKKTVTNISLIFLSCIIGILLCELILRIHNPLPSRVSGNSIKLLANYERNITLKNGHSAGLDKSIHYSTNSIGFRGDNPPALFEDFYTIFTIGGSTTECSLLDDTKTWSHLLHQSLLQEFDSIWLNNAGIDGCSTFGHKILLSEHIFKFKPDMVIFLVGVNEMLVANSNLGDRFLGTTREYKLRELSQKSELLSFIWNLYRLQFSKEIKVKHGYIGELVELQKKEFEDQYEFYLSDQKTYRERLDSMVKECIKRGVIPVLVTQPIYNLTKYNKFFFVQLYNEVTIDVGLNNDVFVIDLSSKLANLPEYYYDPMHYTNQGAKEVARIIFNELKTNSNFQ